MLTIPPHHSLIEGISISITPWDKNLGVEGSGDHHLEDWFWVVEVENHANPFVLEKGAWTVYVTRSKLEKILDFNTGGHATVFQLMPGEAPTKLVVEERVISDMAGIWLVVYYDRADGEAMLHCAGLHKYEAA